jgi:hypothetical protein
VVAVGVVVAGVVCGWVVAGGVVVAGVVRAAGVVSVAAGAGDEDGCWTTLWPPPLSPQPGALDTRRMMRGRRGHERPTREGDKEVLR